MTHDDALLAFERHATSKLQNGGRFAFDCDAGISRRGAADDRGGFAAAAGDARGGAEENEQGTRIEFAGGKLVGVKPAGAAGGNDDQRGGSFLLRAGAAEISEVGDDRAWATSLRW